MWCKQDSKALLLRFRRAVKAFQSRASGDECREAKEEALMAQGKERTKEQLYRQAKKLGVKGRSKMNKGQLKAAISRRGG